MPTAYRADSESSFDFQLRLDRICREFERRWGSSSAWTIEETLTRFPPARHEAALQELVATEVAIRFAAGQIPEQDEYSRRFPAAAESIARVFVEAQDEQPLPPDAIGLPSAKVREPFDGRSSPRDETPRHLGDRLGDYRIVREIGRGGMGIVYEAVQESLGRRVALKVLPFAASLNPDGRARFQQEAFTAAKLKHWNIVSVYDAGTEDGVPYIAMELIEGSSLAGLIRRPTVDRRAPDAVPSRDLRVAEPGQLGQETASGLASPGDSTTPLEALFHPRYGDAS